MVKMMNTIDRRKGKRKKNVLDRKNNKYTAEVNDGKG